MFSPSSSASLQAAWGVQFDEAEGVAVGIFKKGGHLEVKRAHIGIVHGSFRFREIPLMDIWFQ